MISVLFVLLRKEIINLISNYFKLMMKAEEDATEYWNRTCSKLGTAAEAGRMDPEWRVSSKNAYKKARKAKCFK